MSQRRTKIVATIGPASSSSEVLEGLIRAGLDVVRLNFSHGTHADHAETYERIRAAEHKLGRPVAILQDLQGPKIRFGKIDGEVHLAPGDPLTLSSQNNFIGSGNRLPTTYPQLAKDVRPGEDILLADGRLRLTVKAVEGDEVHTEVIVGGVLTSSKGINLPGTAVSVPALTEKDEADLEFGLGLGVDYVALSFVRSPHDITRIKERMRQHGRVVPVIAKIEKPEAVEKLEAIVDAVEGIMVARGDLGVELPAEQVPPIQRRAIRLARERGKISVVATQMLMSMAKNARPTHAEVSDVANAVFDGADAVMLSEETAVGKYPVRAVETMGQLAESAEQAPEENPVELLPSERFAHLRAISRAAVVTAGELDARAVAVHTISGRSPRLMSTWRPRCMIIGCASTDEDVRRMSIYWGVRGLKIAPPSSVETLVALVEAAALEKRLLSAGDTIIITSKLPFTEGEQTNMLKIHTLERSRSF